MPGGAPRKLKDGKVRSLYLDDRHWEIIDSIAGANTKKLGRQVNASEVVRLIIESHFTIREGHERVSFLTKN